MNALSESQTDLIISWVKSHHLTITTLENEFIDHMCCDVEELMSEGKSFKSAFERLKSDLGDDILPGLEKQTLLLLTFNQRIMKFIMRLAGILVLLFFFAAIIAKMLEVDYWRTLMAGGMLILGLGFSPLFFLQHYRQQEVKSQKVLHILGFLSALLIPVSAFLGLLNSPYALTLMITGIIFLLLGFIPLSWLSVSKGSARSAITGSIIFLLFFILLSYGFMGVRISKDRINSWVFLSNSAEQSALCLEKMNSDWLKRMKSDSAAFAKASELSERSDKIVREIYQLKSNFILGLDPSFKPGDQFYQGMDNNFAGEKLLIKSEACDHVLTETSEFEEWILSLLSTDNEKLKQEISRLLKNDMSTGTAGIYAQKVYLFRDFPAIADVSVINSMILNLRIAEYQTLVFLASNHFPETVQK